MSASSLIDKQGRKSLLMTSFSGMAISMLLLSLSFTWKVLAPYSGPLAVIGTVMYVLSFSLGAGHVPAHIDFINFLHVKCYSRIIPALYEFQHLINWGDVENLLSY